MLIDWFTTIAQIINFLILVLLLKHFLYGPIIRAMDKREAKISSRLRDASQSKKEAEEERKNYRVKSDALEKERQDILQNAREEAEKVREERLAEIRAEMHEIRRKWRHDLTEQQASFLRDLRSRAIDEVFALARRTLHDLADQSLEEKMAEVFIRHLTNMDRESMQKIKQAVADAEGVATVLSVFETSADSRGKITRALHEVFGVEITVQYKRDPELLAGFKLKGGHNLIGWNIENYLADFEEEVLKVAGKKTAA